MASKPDFSVRTPATPPTAFADVLQRRKALELQIEQDNRNKRQQRFKGIIDAIEAGQRIASNALENADARQKKKGRKRLQSLLQQPEPEFVLSPEERQRRLDQRRKDITSAAQQASPKEFEKRIAEQAIPTKTTKGTPPRSTESLGVFKLLDGDFGDPKSPAAIEGMKAFVQNLEPSGIKFTDNRTGEEKLYNPVTDQTIVLPTAAEKGTVKITSLEQLDALPPVRRKRTEKVVDDTLKAVQTDKVITRLRQAELDADALKNIIVEARNNPAAVPIIPFRTIRAIAQEVGNLNKSEVERGGGNQAVWAKIRRFAKTGFTGNLPTQDLEDFFNLAQIAQEKSGKQLAREEDKHIFRLQKRAPNIDRTLADELVRGKKKASAKDANQIQAIGNALGLKRRNQ